jgi:hypothetical protein
MFAAMPTESDRQLEFFRLALRLIDRGSNDLPSPLCAHFDRVLQQARQLQADPESISPDVIPQAVHLANDLKKVAGLSDALADVERIGDVSQEIAHKVLHSLEPNLASAD